MVIAADDIAVAETIQRAFSTPALRFYTSQDVVGVEIGGALKNVIALGAGVCAGLGLGSNSVAALVTRGLGGDYTAGRGFGWKRAYSERIGGARGSSVNSHGKSFAESRGRNAIRAGPEVARNFGADNNGSGRRLHVPGRFSIGIEARGRVAHYSQNV
jgi:hypothetical protein